MKHQNDNFYILTGGPGVGKTSVLDELQKSGYIVMPETARAIIKEQMAVDGEALPWKNKESYMRLMLEASAESYQEAISKNISRILVTCSQENEASRRTILACGGVLEDIREGTERYWIEGK